MRFPSCILLSRRFGMALLPQSYLIATIVCLAIGAPAKAQETAVAIQTPGANSIFGYPSFEVGGWPFLARSTLK